MKNVAEFTLIGRVGKVTTNGTVTRLSIASNYPRRQDDGSYRDDTHWNTVVVFAEGTRRYLAEQVGTGDLVMARGRLRESRYEKNGQTRYGVDLICLDLGKLASKQPDPTEGLD